MIEQCDWRLMTVYINTLTDQAPHQIHVALQSGFVNMFCMSGVQCRPQMYILVYTYAYIHTRVCGCVCVCVWGGV